MSTTKEQLFIIFLLDIQYHWNLFQIIHWWVKIFPRFQDWSLFNQRSILNFSLLRKLHDQQVYQTANIEVQLAWLQGDQVTVLNILETLRSELHQFSLITHLRNRILCLRFQSWLQWLVGPTGFLTFWGDFWRLIYNFYTFANFKSSVGPISFILIQHLP